MLFSEKNIRMSLFFFGSYKFCWRIKLCQNKTNWTSLSVWFSLLNQKQKKILEESKPNMRLKCQNFRHLHVKMDITATNVYINLLCSNYFQTIKDWFKTLKHYKLLLNNTNYHIKLLRNKIKGQNQCTLWKESTHC